MKQMQIKCPYCGSKAIYRPASMVYGSATKDKSAHLYVCSKWPACDSYVNVHKKSRLPMGTLANGNLRHKRIMAHKALSAFQRYRGMDKWAAYLWLQINLGLSPEQTHIGMFSEEMCGKVISLCRKALESGTSRAA